MPVNTLAGIVEPGRETPLVIHHGGGCYDGFCAAWVLWRHFKGDVILRAANYDQGPPPYDECAGRVVFVVDFSYPRAEMLEIAVRAAKLIVLDHHKTAQADLAGLVEEAMTGPGFRPPVTPEVVFDMDRSGGRLAWEWTTRNGGDLLACPWLVRYTEDRDLWRHSLYVTREINAYLRTFDFDMHLWDKLHTTSPCFMIEPGAAILNAQAKVVDQHVRNAGRVKIAGYDVLCANATVFQSEIGGALAVGEAFAATYFDTADGHRVYSLRADQTRPGWIDVSDIARQFGGGGHPGAAGFRVAVPKLALSWPEPVEDWNGPDDTDKNGY